MVTENRQAGVPVDFRTVIFGGGGVPVLVHFTRLSTDVRFQCVNMQHSFMEFQFYWL